MIHSLFDTTAAHDIITRIQALTPSSPRQRGTMTVDQMLEHCARGIDMAAGKLIIPRVFLGYILGGVFKKHILKDEPIGE
jgi:hypothetical protein